MVRRALVVIALLGGGCDTGGLDWARPPSVTRASPADGATDVERLTTLRVELDDLLSPRSVSRATVSLRSGPRTHLLSVRFDPVRRAIVARDWGGVPFEPNVEYELRVEGARSLEGAPVPPVLIRFRTGEALGVVEREGTTGWEQAGPILATRCAPCHDDVQREQGLALTSAEGVARSAIGVVARQTARVGGADRGLGGMARIHVVAGVGDPAQSYLVYKLLDHAPILGEPMPPAESLTSAEVATLVDWILAGAPTD